MINLSRISCGERRSLAQNLMGETATVEAFDTYLEEQQVTGNVENYLGAVPIPTGLAGPMQTHGGAADGEYVVPMATTEGALVASYSRSMRLVSACGGATTTLISDEFVRETRLITQSVSDARELQDWCRNNAAKLCTIAEETSRHLRVTDLSTDLLGASVLLRLHHTTGDAMGSNMGSKAITAVARHVTDNHTAPIDHITPVPNEKTPAVGRRKGKRLVAEAHITRDMLARFTRADLDVYQRTTELALNAATTQSAGPARNIHAANGMAAVFAACGQDLAYLPECASEVFTETRMVDADTASVTVTIPSLIVGTIGGGTRLPAHHAALALLGCTAEGSALKLAEIIAAVVLCGEIGTVAAATTGDFVKAHERLGKNRG